MPKSLTEDTGIRSWPRKGILASLTLLRSCLVLNKISLVLLRLISNWSEQHQLAIWRRSSVILARQESVFLNEKERSLRRQHRIRCCKT